MLSEELLLNLKSWNDLSPTPSYQSPYQPYAGDKAIKL